MFWRGVEALSRILQWPLPANPWLQRSVALILSALPFLPLAQLQLRTSHTQAVALLLIMGALYAMIYMIVTALLIWDDAALAIMAKRVGFMAKPSPRLSGLDTSPFWGFVQLFLVVLCVAGTAVTAASGITTSLISNFDLQSPFASRPTGWQVFLYFMDQSMKGVLFDFCEVFQVSLQRTLTHRPAFDEAFPYSMVLYRLLMNALTLQVMFLGVTYLFFTRRDQRVPIADELVAARRQFSDAHDALLAAEQKIQDRRSQPQLKKLAAEYKALRSRRGRRSRSARQRLNELERILTNNDWFR